MSDQKTPKIHLLKPKESLRGAWAHEDRDFTPWVVKNIDVLSKALNMELEVVKEQKTLPGGGRVDIYAQQVNTEEKVVIENQLEPSDNDHCLRLIGYAADSEANILVWLARDFDPYHLRIMEWLNEADTINIYAVKVQLYCVNGALATDLQTVVEPPQSQETASRSDKKSSNTLYAEFYRPLVASLRRSDVHKVGKGGWQGKWRLFHAGLPGVGYATGAKDSGVQVFLSLGRERFNQLQKHQKEINRELSKLSGRFSWTEEDNWHRIILESIHQFRLTAPEAEWEVARQWIVKNMPLFKDILQPHIDQLRKDEEAASGAQE